MANNDANSDNPNPAVNNDNAAETLLGEPAAKKLRSSDPDLTVILKYSVESEEEENGDATEDDKENTKDNKLLEKTYQMYGNHLAKHSKFVDTALSLPMSEKNTRTVTFTDVTPDTFELALSFLENPLAIREMKAEEAVQVVGFFDKYEFVDGIKLCDHVMHEYLEKEGHYLPRKRDAYGYYEQDFDYKIPPDNLDFLVNLIVLADEMNLAKAKESGIKYLTSRFGSSHDHIPYGRTMFMEEHIKKLHSMFKQRDLGYHWLTQEEIESPLFPKFFLKEWSQNKLDDVVMGIEVSDSRHKVIDGRYKRDDDDQFSGADRPHEIPLGDGRKVEVVIRRSRLCDGDWAVVGEVYDEDGDWVYDEDKAFFTALTQEISRILPRKDGLI